MLMVLHIRHAFVGEKSRLQCAGLNRHEVENERVLQERSSEPPGPESCAATARDPAKRRQGMGGVGDRASKRYNPDADVFVMRGRQHEREREREFLPSPA
jgi:hypothetical protein